MKKKIKNYVIDWKKPLLLNLLPLGIGIIGSILERDFLVDIALVVFYLNILGTIASIVVQVINRKFFYAVFQLALTCFLFYYVSLIFIYAEPDYYGAHKEIPQGIEISEPLTTHPSQNDYKNYDLMISNSVQPGIYNYYTDFVPNERGFFFIKAYEITSNDQLSESRIKQKSKVEASGSVPAISQGEFTIYEGSWGDKYGSRIELWYHSEKGNKEFKITERNFIVEGWMR